MSFALNVPLGAVRTRARKFSAAWFIAIHAAIPLIIVMRIVVLDISPWWIIGGVIASVLGQVFGARVLAPGHWHAIGAAKHEERTAQRAAAKSVAEPASK